MADWFVHLTFSNVLISSVLAIFAWILHRKYQAAPLANLIWILVLIKLITPPLFSVPLLEVSLFDAPQPLEVASSPDSFAELEHEELMPSLLESPLSDEAMDLAAEPATLAGLLSNWRLWVGATWLLGSLTIMSISLVWILKFHLLIRKSSEPAPKWLVGMTHRLANQFELPCVVNVLVSPADVAPFVWWIGGRPSIVVSASATQKLSRDDLKMALGHEVAHIKRRDHWVRWLEWVAGVVFWWNPVLWLARQQLRLTEEIACDALAVATMNTDHHHYASSLLNVAELLTTSAIRPPAVASAMLSGGLLEKRLMMIIAEKKLQMPNWVRGSVIALAMCLFPVGLVGAQDVEAVERRLGEAVAEGDITLEQANIMLEALKSHMEHEYLKDRHADHDHAHHDHDVHVHDDDHHGDHGEHSHHDHDGHHENHFHEDHEHDNHFLHELREREQELAARQREFAEVARAIEREVKAGGLSKRDAEAKMIELKQELFGHQQQLEHAHRELREMEEREVELQAVAQEIEMAVKSGKISKEDARRKLAEIHEKMRADREKREPRERRNREAKEKHFREVLQQMEQAVAAGKLKPEQAREKMEAIRRQIAEQEEAQRELENQRLRQRELEREHARQELQIRELERREMEIQKQHDRLRRHSQEQKVREQEERRAAQEMELKKLADEIQQAIKAGDLSKAEGRKKLQALEDRMFRKDRKSDQPRKNQSIEVLKERVAKEAEKIKAAIENGDLSKKDGEKKLIEMQRRVEEQLKKQRSKQGLNFFNRVQSNAKTKVAQTELKQMHYAAKAYVLNTGKKIKNLEDLVRLPETLKQQQWQGPYLEELRNDPWGNPYRTQQKEGKLQLASNGPDGKNGTADDIVD